MEEMTGKELAHVCREFGLATYGWKEDFISRIESHMDEMTQAELKDRCKRHGLPIYGAKSELVVRLASGIVQEAKRANQKQVAPAPKKLSSATCIRSSSPMLRKVKKAMLHKVKTAMLHKVKKTNMDKATSRPSPLLGKTKTAILQKVKKTKKVTKAMLHKVKTTLVKAPSSLPKSRSSLSKHQKTNEQDDSDSESDVDTAMEGMSFSDRNRAPKEKLVAELLCRWWYVLPDWPPNDEGYYRAQLKKRSLRRVEIAEWETEPDKDSKGLRKVFALGQFPGVYRDSAGQLHDLRPQDTCPCFNNFMNKGILELLELLAGAYKNQIKILSKTVSGESTTATTTTKLIAKLQLRLSCIKEQMRLASGLSSEKQRTEVYIPQEAERASRRSSVGTLPLLSPGRDSLPGGMRTPATPFSKTRRRLSL